MPALRKIIHVDCDCFYASIEMRDNPRLRDLPVAVGGSPERRGVVATCNYPARRLGIHSAMASATARRLCPDLVIIRPDMARYRQASQQIQTIFHEYTDLVEPLSLDEAYLDVTSSSRFDGSASRLASELRQRIRSEVGITVSAGVAPNKFLAKIASDWHKPDGLFVINPEQVDAFVSALPVRKLHGVGKVTAARMHGMGISSCADLRRLDREELDSCFDSFGQRLYELCRGIDQRPVQPSRIRKSLSVEHTYPADLPDLEACLDACSSLHEQLIKRMAAIEQDYAVAKQVVKIKFLDFSSTTVETVSANTDPDIFKQLIEQGYARGKRPVRLIGLGVRLEPVHARPAPATGSTMSRDRTNSNKKIQLALNLD